MRLLVLLLLCMALAACGFQLRQELALPAGLDAIRVETGDPYGPLQRRLEQALQRAGASTAAGSPAVLRVLNARIEQKPLSIGIGGRVQEYLLQYTAEIELLDGAGRAILPRQSLELEREYRFDTADALGSPGEEEVLREDLERAMGEAILRRVDAVLRG
ncbi:LPS assembly lipoprotein LptE [Pseudomarimonas salicorniae]|uniref:LPS-assembly lipoprotein LptE n=1 Tax=Pseudomarimonas salicorniae TaxID=2933270 RepID=A0ABT0GKW3_9GAMM|nr:LPS assembly lipoprotein LptE [Lysobacter sp. CAU 1642]MCK7595181.1 LPS assembly lipoprotein LptE [Lysobacter sp. CAU 1642]